MQHTHRTGVIGATLAVQAEQQQFRAAVLVEVEFGEPDVARSGLAGRPLLALAPVKIGEGLVRHASGSGQKTSNRSLSTTVAAAVIEIPKSPTKSPHAKHARAIAKRLETLGIAQISVLMVFVPSPNNKASIKQHAIAVMPCLQDSRVIPRIQVDFAHHHPSVANSLDDLAGTSSRAAPTRIGCHENELVLSVVVQIDPSDTQSHGPIILPFRGGGLRILGPNSPAKGSPFWSRQSAEMQPFGGPSFRHVAEHGKVPVAVAPPDLQGVKPFRLIDFCNGMIC